MTLNKFGVFVLLSAFISPSVVVVAQDCFAGCLVESGEPWICTHSAGSLDGSPYACRDCPDVDETCRKLCSRCTAPNYGGLNCDCTGYLPQECRNSCYGDSVGLDNWVCDKADEDSCAACTDPDRACEAMCKRCPAGTKFGGLDCTCPTDPPEPTAAPVKPKDCWAACNVNDVSSIFVCDRSDMDACATCPDVDATCDVLCNVCDEGSSYGGLYCDCPTDTSAPTDSPAPTAAPVKPKDCWAGCNIRDVSSNFVCDRTDVDACGTCPDVDATCDVLCEVCGPTSSHGGLTCDCPAPTTSEPTASPAPTTRPKDCWAACNIDQPASDFVCDDRIVDACATCPNVTATCDVLCNVCDSGSSYGGLGCNCETAAPTETPDVCFPACELDANEDWVCTHSVGATEPYACRGCADVDAICAKLCTRCPGPFYGGLDCECPTPAPVTSAPSPAGGGACFPACYSANVADNWVCSHAVGADSPYGCRSCPDADNVCEVLCKRCDAPNFGGLDCDCTTDAPSPRPVGRPTDCWNACASFAEASDWVCDHISTDGCARCLEDDVCEALCKKCPDGSTHGGLHCNCTTYTSAPTAVPVRPKDCWNACAYTSQGSDWVCDHPDTDGCFDCLEEDVCEALCEKCPDGSTHGGKNCDCSLYEATPAPTDTPKTCWGACFLTTASSDWVCEHPDKGCTDCNATEVCPTLCSKCGSDSAFGGLACTCSVVPSPPPVLPPSQLDLCYPACGADIGEKWVCKYNSTVDGAADGCEGCLNKDDVCRKLCQRCDGPEYGGLDCDCGKPKKCYLGGCTGTDPIADNWVCDKIDEDACAACADVDRICDILCERCPDGSSYGGLNCTCPTSAPTEPTTPTPTVYVPPTAAPTKRGNCYNGCTLAGTGNYVCGEPSACGGCTDKEAACQELCKKCPDGSYGGLDCDCSICQPGCTDLSIGNWVCTRPGLCTDCDADIACPVLCEKCAGLDGVTFGGLIGGCDCGSLSPTGSPTVGDGSTDVPSAAPSESPSSAPSSAPSGSPSSSPSAAPSSAPSASPTGPTATPTSTPTGTAPTSGPTPAPTDAPTTSAPSASPSESPSSSPSAAPSSAPSAPPSFAPSSSPTEVTAAPTGEGPKCKPGCYEGLSPYVCTQPDDCTGCPDKKATCDFLCQVNKCNVGGPWGGLDCRCEGQCAAGCTDPTIGAFVCDKDAQCKKCYPEDNVCDVLCSKCGDIAGNVFGGYVGGCECPTPVPTDSPTDTPTISAAPTEAATVRGNCFDGCSSGFSDFVCGQPSACLACPDKEATCEYLCNNKCGFDGPWGGLDCRCGECKPGCTDPTIGTYVCDKPALCRGCYPEDACEVLCGKCLSVDGNVFGGLVGGCPC